MENSNSYISVILPCFNERENILALVVAVDNALIRFKREIIVVDDNSPDGTYQALVEKSFPNVVPILRTHDKGFANSIRCGIEKSKGNIVIVMDSDFNHKPEYLPFMVDNISYYDCVSGSRYLYGGVMENPVRFQLSWLFNIFVRLMTGGKITDSLYGFFAIKREVLVSVDFNKVFWGYGDYCIRLFYYLQKKNIGVLQFPAINGKRIAGEGNSRLFKVFRQYFTEVIKLAYSIRIKKDV